MCWGRTGRNLEESGRQGWRREAQGEVRGQGREKERINKATSPRAFLAIFPLFAFTSCAPTISFSRSHFSLASHFVTFQRTR